MISSYHTIDHRVNSALLLAAVVIEHAKADSKRDSRVNNMPVACEETYKEHTAQSCARDFLREIEDFQLKNPEADHIEIAIEVLSICLR